MISSASRMFGLGHGGTWPGEIMLQRDPLFLQKQAATVRKGIILVAGTNGKTTTAAMIWSILLASGESTKRTLVHNSSGANMANGIASAFINHSSWFGLSHSDYAVFEVDENTLPKTISNFIPIESGSNTKNQACILVLLNLFRDQLDRYGEVDSIREKWKQALRSLPKSSRVVLNADDPGIAFLGKNIDAHVAYFGINRHNEYRAADQNTSDVSHCPSCGAKLTFKGVYFAHMGDWSCPSCSFRRPKPGIVNWQSPLPGLYNQYNALAAAGVTTALHIPEKIIKRALAQFAPAFGRQEEILCGNKTVKLFLSKNPASFNASLQTILSLRPKALLLVLNDRIPDGRDVSWVWDTDMESVPQDIQIIVSGDRAWDMGLRVKYAQKMQNAKINPDSIGVKMQNYGELKIIEKLEEAIEEGLRAMKDGETLHVLPTYSAMLSVRKILTGRKIL